MRRHATRALLVSAAVAAGLAACSGPGEPPPDDSLPSLPPVDLAAPFPDETTTGVPPGTSLQPSGDLDIERSGTVIEGLDIDGCVDVRANDVTIRASRITCARPTTAVRLFDGYGGLTLEDVEIDGSGVVSTAVGFSHYKLLRANIHHVIDGPRVGTATVVQDSYVHDLVRTDGSHNDALQVTGGSNIVVRHNTLDAYDEASGDYFNAAIQVGSSKAPVEDLLIEGNYLNGGNYTVNFRPDLAASGIVGRGNTFGPNHRYGPLARGDLPGVEWTGSPGPTGAAHDQG